ncbi:MAG: phosphatase [Acidimicrobiales bacterium]
MSSVPSSADLAGHLVSSHLAGVVATPARSCVVNCQKMVAGDPDYTFGLSDWKDATYDDAVAALRACGVTLAEDPSGTAFVDPHVAMAAIERHRAHLGAIAAGQGRVLIATGHAFAFLSHYQAIADALRAAGCEILEPLEGRHRQFLTKSGDPASIRYFGGIASLVLHGCLEHTHRPDYMEALLDEARRTGPVDAVIGDHGFAGAGVEAGILTLSIADVNDPALPLAQAHGRTDGVLVVDDGLVPAVYEPLTAFMLADV